MCSVRDKVIEIVFICVESLRGRFKCKIWGKGSGWRSMFCDLGIIVRIRMFYRKVDFVFVFGSTV